MYIDGFQGSVNSKLETSWVRAEDVQRSWPKKKMKNEKKSRILFGVSISVNNPLPLIVVIILC